MTKRRDRNKSDIFTLYAKDKLPVNEIAQKYNVSTKTMYRWLKQWNILAVKVYPEVM